MAWVNSEQSYAPHERWAKTTRDITGRLSVMIRDQNRLTVPLTASFGPGFIKLIATGLRQMSVVVEAGIRVATPCYLLQRRQIARMS